MRTLFEIESSIGCVVRTSESYWRLIETKHPEVKGKIEAIRETIANPNMICRSKHDISVYLFYRRANGYWWCAVVKCLDGDAFVITSYITDNIKEGEIIWQR